VSAERKVDDRPVSAGVMALADELHCAAYELFVGPFKVVVLLPNGVPDERIREVFGVSATFLRTIADGLDGGIGVLPASVPMSKGGDA
jgi:hypothetical protein